MDPHTDVKPLNKKVLVIDDDRMLHSMLKPMLEGYGFGVVSALTGEEGLALAASDKPDAIVLDVIMPKMKGREVCKALKASDGTKHIPVFFLTAKDSADDIHAEFEIGAEGHLTKPVNPALLVEMIKKALRV
jgi:CheY-like chemotaxis protein